MNNCKIIRRKLVIHQSLNLLTGETTYKGEEWKTEPCGTPIFGNNKEQTICNTCLKGWTDERNYPLNTEENKILFAENQQFKRQQNP